MSGSDPTASDDEEGVISLMKSTGASARDIAATRAVYAQRRAQAARFGVWPCNWYAFKVFCALRTQWQVVMGGKGLIWLGLNYAAVAPVHAALRHVAHRTDWPTLMGQLADLEDEALTWRNRA